MGPVNPTYARNTLSQGKTFFDPARDKVFAWHPGSVIIHLHDIHLHDAAVAAGSRMSAYQLVALAKS